MAVNIGKIISELRKQKAWNQTELATQSAVSREMIGKDERGEALPSLKRLKNCDAFAVSLDYLEG